jgi:hypothetical protein
MIDSKRQNMILTKQHRLKTAEIRPVAAKLYSFLIHPDQPYNFIKVRNQIQAAKEQGVNQFLLWSANCKYEYRS